MGEKIKPKAPRLQYGALPYRFRPDGSIEILLVTTRRTRRWIVPKGWKIKGKKPPKSAAQEAFEEAGVQGVVSGKPIGSFVYDKWLDDDGVTAPCEVRIFPLLVKRQGNTWRECEEREARWVDPGKALEMIDDQGLRDLIAAFADRQARKAKTPAVEAPRAAAAE
ncbi:MAG: NUDIX hydrolase [Inquilinus limosus]|uniref:NUDIX hydrolase n=1 Tax=Inquilinus limosus TaxID=171674 RepID=A0A952FPN4_9PROT|nr:NUDIX hydrolase [Inquilinus limosus]